MTLAPPPSVMNQQFPDPKIRPLPQPRGGLIVRGIRRLAQILLKPFGIVVALMAIPLYLMVVGFVGEASALAIASAVAIVAPFALKLFPQAGRYMLVITWVVAAVIAVVAEVVGGDISFNPLPSDPAQLYVLFGYTFGVTQAVYAYFKDHPLGGLSVK